MEKFSQKPVHDEAWWRSRELINIIGFDDEMCNSDEDGRADHVEPENWVACADYYRLSGCFGCEVLFPTVTDCLYWIRWILLTSDCDVKATYSNEEVELFGAVKEIAQEIDEAPEGTNAGEMILNLRERIYRSLTNKNFELFYIKSEEEYLRDESEGF